MPYKHLFFDLDDTLWDSRRNATEALCEIFDTHGLGQCPGLDREAFIAQFHTVNYALWDRYSAGQITQDELRQTRFPLVFQALGVACPPDVAALQADFLALCPRKPHLMPHALRVLDYLREKYRLHIITNGFNDVQSVKMESAGISGYFEAVVTAHHAGFHKPNRQIFDFALQRAAALCPDSLMIGDNLLADVGGARNAGLDHVYYNPGRTAHQAAPTYEVHCLSELMELL